MNGQPIRVQPLDIDAKEDSKGSKLPSWTLWVREYIDFESLQDFSTGVLFGSLLIRAFDISTSVVDINLNPTNMIHRLDNCSKILSICRQELGVKLLGSSPEDIVDGNEKVVWALLHTLHVRYAEMLFGSDTDESSESESDEVIDSIFNF